MAANRYTTLKDFGYQDVYVPQPFETIAAVGEQKQKKFDAAKAEEDAWLNQIRKVGAIEEHKPRLQQISGEYKKQFESIVDEAGGDYSKALPKIQKLGRDMSFDLQGGELGAIQTTYNEYGKLKGDIAKQKARDPYYSTKLGGEGQFSGYLSGYQPGSQVKGAYIYNQPVHEKADEAKWAKDFFDPIKADAKEVGSTNPITGAVYKGGVKEITQQKINGAALDAAQHKQLPADLNEEIDLTLRDNPQNILRYANQFLTETYGNDPQIQKILEDPNQAYMFAKAGVIADLGNKFKFKETSNINDYNVGLLKFNKKKAEEDALKDPANIQTFWGNAQTNTNVNALAGSGLETIKLDEAGNPIESKEVKTASAPGGSIMGTGLSTTQISTPESKKKLQSELDALNRYRTENPALANASNKEVLDAITQARTNMQRIHNLSYDIPILDPKKLTSRVMANPDGLAFKLQGDEDAGFADLKNVADKLGLDPETFKASLKSGLIGKISPANNGAYEYTIQDKAGIPQTVYIKGSDQMQSHYAPATIIATREKEGKSGEYKIGSITVNEGTKEAPKLVKKEGYAQTQLVNTNAGSNLPANWTYQTITYPTLSTTESKSFVKDSGKSVEELKNEGYRFTQDNKLILTSEAKTPDIFFKDLQAEWINSGYEFVNRQGLPKNTTEAENED